MTTLLAKRAGAENPIATNDVHLETMTADPSIPQFPSTGGFGNSFGTPSVVTPAVQQKLPEWARPTPPAPPPMNLTQSGDNAATGAEVLVQHDKDSTDWINKKWRPAMGWMYLLCCVADFVIFPILWSILQALSKGQVTSQWQPVTLQGAGLFHISMGAIIGVTAYGRTKEKLAEKS